MRFGLIQALAAKYKFVLLILLLSPSVAFAQAYEAALKPVRPGANYASIEFLARARAVDLPLTSKEYESLPEAMPRSKALRLVVYRSEIYQSLVIETVTEGVEGCCSRVASARAFDLEAFASHFGFKSEVTGFSFAGWTSPTSFRFTYQGKPFKATVLNASTIRIRRGAAANNSFKPKPLRGSA